MIKAKELCIGDLVKYNNKIYEVEEIDSKSNTIIVKSDTEEIYNTKNLIICDDLEPIEITPEILLKNGWTAINGGNIYNLALPHYQSIIYYYNLPDEIVSYNDAGRKVEIKKHLHYVHKLQQLLRALDVDEKYINITI